MLLCWEFRSCCVWSDDQHLQVLLQSPTHHSFAWHIASADMRPLARYSFVQAVRTSTYLSMARLRLDFHIHDQCCQLTVVYVYSTKSLSRSDRQVAGPQGSCFHSGVAFANSRKERLCNLVPWWLLEQWHTIQSTRSSKYIRARPTPALVIYSSVHPYHYSLRLYFLIFINSSIITYCIF